MHISGPAARWWQSVESRLSHVSWKIFRTHLLDRFGKDEHDLLIRKLFHIKQTGTVAEYISQFTELVDQLAAYESTADSKYYTMCFIDGLRPEIRSIVLLHRPRNLDTACALASLQDEVGDPPKLRDFKRPAYSSFTAAPVKGPHPLPSPAQFDKSKPAVDSKSPVSVQPSSDQDKLTALKAYHRAMGQCYKCGDKWSRGHSCPQAVQLHVVQELRNVHGRRVSTGSCRGGAQSGRQLGRPLLDRGRKRRRKAGFLVCATKPRPRLWRRL